MDPSVVVIDIHCGSQLIFSGKDKVEAAGSSRFGVPRNNNSICFVFYLFYFLFIYLFIYLLLFNPFYLKNAYFEI